MKTCYLAGPIGGLDYAGATSWREYARGYLREHGIHGRSPMRGKQFLQNVGTIGKQGYDQHPLASQAGVTTRDRFDCTTSDVVLFNFLGADRVSIGSCIELGWADGARRPIVVVMEDPIRSPGNPNDLGLAIMNPHDHLIVKGVAGYVVPTLDEALLIVAAILGDLP